jgi:23S rRNA (guanosine2251-2'-O)-methyltransferase
MQTIWIWGWHPVQQALSNPDRRVVKIIITKPQLREKLPPLSPSILSIAPPRQLEGILPPEAVHQGIAALVSLPPSLSLADIHPEKGFVVALDGVTDPHNVGALWRSAAVFGAQALLLTHRHCPPLDGTVAKAACGAMEWTPYVQVTNLSAALITLKKRGFFCVGLCETGTIPLPSFDLSPCILIIGAEGKGIRHLTREMCDAMIHIPSHSAFTTLNASVAGAVTMAHLAGL